MEKFYEESIFDADNNNIFSFDNKYKSWFSVLFNCSENIGNIQK